MPSLVIDDFSGGLNLRDSSNQLATNECQFFGAATDTINNVITERGGLRKRKGCGRAVDLPGVTLKKAYLFYSAALDCWWCARESGGVLKLFSAPSNLSGATWTDCGTINSVVTAQAAFIDFPGNPPKLVVTTDVNSGATKGVWTTTGAGVAVTNVSATVAGNSIALWQNKAWIGGYPTSDANGNPTRLFRSAAGDPATWTDSVDIREKDAEPLTALATGAGGLVVFKKRSTYRVNDASSGAFTSIDQAVGCVNPRAVTALRGRLFVWGANGMYECDGVGALTNRGDKIRPVYTDAGTDLATICAGVHQDHVLFSGQIYNSVYGRQMIFDYAPAVGAIMPLSLASTSQDEITSFATYSDGQLHAAVADGDDIFRMFDANAAGSDDTTAYASSYTTPWLLPNSGMLSRLHRARVQGLAQLSSSVAVSVKVFKDWVHASADTYVISTDLRATSANQDQLASDMQALGHAASFAIQFTTDAVAGDVSIRALQLIDQQLQWPNPGYPRHPTVGTHNPTPSGGGGPSPPTS